MKILISGALGYMGREYDALLVRAVVAAEMADCENGIRSMLLAADWFVAMAMQVASLEMEEAVYNEDLTSLQGISNQNLRLVMQTWLLHPELSQQPNKTKEILECMYISNCSF